MAKKNFPEVVGNSSDQTDEIEKGEFKNWIFTSYNKTAPIFDDTKMKFLAYGDEICPKTKRKHWQGFVCFINKVSWKVSGKRLKGTCKKDIWHKVMHGSLKSNENYCSKEHKYAKFGILPSQGARTDLDDIHEDMKNGKSVVDIAYERPKLYHQYGRTLHFLEQIEKRKKHRTEYTTCEWFYGSTGAGKSHIAFENFHEDTHYLWEYDLGWQDSYKQQDTVIINDLRHEIPFQELCRLVDKWPYNIRRRTIGTIPFTSKHIIITSSMHPDEIYKETLHKNDTMEQLYRRMKITKLCNIRLN